ncbi:MAG: VCBS repeat-containing protein [Desulfobulbus sp.]
MKIAESSIQLASSHTSVEYSERRESLTLWHQGKAPLSTQQVDGKGDQLKKKAQTLADQAAKVSLSEAAQQAQAATSAAAGESSEVQELGEDEELMGNLNMRILRALFEKLTGRKFHMLNYGALQKGINASQAAAVSAEPKTEQQSAGWGVEYRNQEMYHESESSQFSAQGIVTTADGRQIEIGLEVNLSRSFTAGREDVLQLGDTKLKDPLVINFDGNAAQLTQDTFSFDIDADGSEDQVAFVAPGSGFLALDSNGDGRINDGSELFGAQSGDGFADLAAFDEDGNGWIDETDSIYSQLRIWTKDASGEDQLLALGDKNIGAIYLGKVATDFSLKNTDNNELQGQVRATGLFLFENGGVGSMQQLDLVA